MLKAHQELRPATEKKENGSSSAALMAAADGGIIGDGRAGVDLALAAGLLGPVIGWLVLRCADGPISTGSVRNGGTAAIVMRSAGSFLAVLHLEVPGPATGLAAPSWRCRWAWAAYSAALGC